MMINSNVFTGSNPKINTPTSPQTRRKNIDFPLHTPLPTSNNPNDYRKEGPLSPQPHYYPQKQAPGKSTDQSLQRDVGLEGVLRELSDRVIKMGQKLAQHQSILIKMTQNSIQSNKEEVKRNNLPQRPDQNKATDSIVQNLTRLRKQFEDYKTGNIITRQIQVKNQLFSDLIHKSEQRIREEMIGLLRRGEDRWQDLDRTVKRLQKNDTANASRIAAAFDKIESIGSSIEGHMDLVNVEVNKAIAKIVGFVNDKVSRPLTESIAQVGERLDRLERLQTEHKLKQSGHFGGLQSSREKSGKECTRAEYRELLSAYSQQIIISERTYYIDSEGFLLDRELHYLVGGGGDRIRLDERQIRMLVSERMLD